MAAATANTFDALKAEDTRPHNRSHPLVVTNEIAIEGLVSLLHEVVAQGALPAL